MSKISQDTIFDNPFEDINANVMDPQTILNFWCDPFTNGYLSKIKEKEFYTSKFPMILEGSRGSGKTTILKYFSSELQFEISQRRKDRSYIKQVSSDGGIGIYFRCDESFVRTFQIIFKHESEDRWVSVFEHYLELFICNQLLDIIGWMKINEKSEISIMKDLQINGLINTTEFSGIKEYILQELSYIDYYKNNALFTDEEFTPTQIHSLYQISTILIENIKKLQPSWKNLNIVLLIDEFENLGFQLQKMFNNLLKFSNKAISFRIGRRSEGLITTETINESEYLRENHDYILISLSSEDSNAIKKYFEEIAMKRFESSEDFKDLNVNQIFRGKEDLDWEAKQIVNLKRTHIEQILKVQQIFRNDPELLKNVTEIISFPKNPIAETLNALWIIRSKDQDVIEVAKETKRTMDLYFDKVSFNSIKKENPKVLKYHNDYANKYKSSLVYLLCSIYKKPKLYYSFNTICFLSNSNARMFMNLCRMIINDTLFYERKKFLSTKEISPETQSRAIREVSQEELNSISSIIQYGQEIGNLIHNLGNVFSDLHKDRRARYPETNQFIFDYNDLSKRFKDIIDTAVSWSVILKKPKAQRASTSINLKTNIYYLNRIFTPLYNISFRTRGGFNPYFTSEEIEAMCMTHLKIYKIDKDRDKKEVTDQQKSEQINLFELEN